MKKLDLSIIIGSPVIAGGTVLLIYAIGSLAEMLGELSLVRAASAIYWATTYPIRAIGWETVPGKTWVFRSILYFVRATLYLTITFPMIVYAAIVGFFGRTGYSIDIKSGISEKAGQFFDSMPLMAQEGLRQPVGNSTEFAHKYLLDHMPTEQDRKWARRLLTRAKDVAATVTALQVVVIFALISHTDFTFQNKQDVSELRDRSSGYLDVIRASREIERAGRRYNIAHNLRLRNIEDLVQTGQVVPPALIVELRRQVDLIRNTGQIELKAPAPNEDKGRKAEEEIPKPTKPKLSRKIQQNDVLSRLGQKLINEISRYSDITRKKEIKIEKKQAKKILINVILIFSSFAFILMYLGYFTTLHNSISSILEAIAQHKHNEMRQGGEGGAVIPPA